MNPRKAIPRSTKPIKRSRVRATGKPSRRFAARRDKVYCEWIRTLECVITEQEVMGTWCHGSVECAHVKARSTGGDDRGNTVPLCRWHHTQQHSIGTQSFQELWDVDLAAIAEQLGREYEAFA